MNNKKMNQMIDEAYENYLKGGDIKWLKQEEVDTPIGKMNIPIPYTKEEFINKCKTDTEFSEKWGLKIEERELSKSELNISYNIRRGVGKVDTNYSIGTVKSKYPSIPTKLITITYNGTKIESYE
jgi:hypothetical protein